MSESGSTGRATAGVAPAVAVSLASLVEYGEGAVVSRTLAKGEGGTLTLFAFDRGEELSEHSAPFDAWVQVLEGRALLTVGGQEVRAGTGEIVLLPAGVPHALRSESRFKMLLVMLRNTT